MHSMLPAHSDEDVDMGKQGPLGKIQNANDMGWVARVHSGEPYQVCRQLQRQVVLVNKLFVRSPDACNPLDSLCSQGGIALPGHTRGSLQRR